MDAILRVSVSDYGRFQLRSSACTSTSSIAFCFVTRSMLCHNVSELRHGISSLKKFESCYPHNVLYLGILMSNGVHDIHQLLAQKEALDRAAIVAFTDLKGTIVEINNMFCEISGYSRDELIGRNHRILNSGYHPHSFFKELFATVGRGGIWRNEIRNINKKGEFYWVDTTIAPVRNEQGKIVRYMAIRFDITERKKAEEVRNKVLADLQNANDELAQFAYRASHDLKSPITRSRELLEYTILDMRTNDIEEAVANSGKIVKQLRSLESLVVDILSLARSDLIKEDSQEVVFDTLFQQVITRLEDDITESKCHVDASINLSRPVVGEVGRYDQIMYNLVSNGIRYRDPGKHKTFVKVTIFDEKGVLHLVVEDNGLGIPENKQGDVFKMFEKYHPTISNGSGLGLSIVKKHIDALGGSIHLQSSPAGTVFEVKIPFDPT